MSTFVFWTQSLNLSFPRVKTNDDAQRILRDLLIDLGENPRRFSEPDILAVTNKQVVGIEVKYRSGNSRQRDYRHFDRYVRDRTDLFRDPQQVKKKGYYELTRNVVILQTLAHRLGCECKLVNLGFSRCHDSAHQFQTLLQPGVNFEFVSWMEFCRKIPSPRPPWLQKYLNAKGLEK